MPVFRPQISDFAPPASTSMSAWWLDRRKTLKHLFSLRHYQTMKHNGIEMAALTAARGISYIFDGLCRAFFGALILPFVVIYALFRPDMFEDNDTITKQ